MATVAILPVKRFDHAKRRLRDELEPDAVNALAESMFTGVVDRLRRVQHLSEIVVVTGDPRAAQIAASHQATVLDDDDAGHNAAAARGIEYALAHGAERALLVPGDCPQLDPAEVARLIEREPPAPSVLVVPDRHGTGTNALLLTPPDAMLPSFGPGSCARHLRIAQERHILAEVVEVPSLALDIDTPADLAALAC